jgi:protease I
MLVEADVVRGRTLTSWPSLMTDLRNAGADWVDREVVLDDNLVTSRKPSDLSAFCSEFISLLSAEEELDPHDLRALSRAEDEGMGPTKLH